jgi:hypothetical protein
MENGVLKSVEPKKTWTAPELKKIDVEEVTASGPEAGADGSLHGS